MRNDRIPVLARLKALLSLGLGMCLVAALSACGGGGGGGGPNASLSLSTQQITVSATTDEPAPTVTLRAVLANPPAAGVYVGYTNTTQGVTGVDFVGTSDTTATISIFLKAPAQLGVGVYTDTVTIYVCYDARCASPVGNSPQSVTVEFRVTAGQNPLPGTPVLATLSPASVAAGSPAFTLTVTGSGFLPQSVLQWNGVARPTSYDSPTQLTAQIDSADIATAGAVAVRVTNAATGGGTSVALDFTVLPPAGLSLSRISPTRVSAGGTAFVLTALGTGFSPASVLQWNGSARATTFVSSTELTAQIAAADIVQAGSATVTVFNPGGLGQVSAAFTLTVAPPSSEAVAFQIDAGHTGTVHFDSVSLPTSSRWSVDLGGAPSYALIAAGKVFVTVSLPGGSSSQLVALDPLTGGIAWGPIMLSGQANAAYDAGTVFVLSSVIGNAGLMQAYDAATGALKWSTLLAGQYLFSAPPTAAHGHVYAAGAGSGGTLYAVDQASGDMAWTRPVANGDSSIPAISSDGVYLTYPCNTYAFRPATGEQTWFDQTGCSGGGGATPVVANGVLYAPNGFGTYSGSTFNAATGALLGAYAADNLPAIGAQTGYFLQSSTLRGISLANSTALWSFAGDGALVTSPIAVNQVVFVGSSSGRLYGLDAASGQQVWEQDLGAPIPAGAGWGARMPISGLSAGNGLLVVPAGNTLTAFSLTGAP